MNGDTLQVPDQQSRELTNEVPPASWRPSPSMAAVLNIIVPGAGRLYVGHPRAAALTLIGLYPVMGLLLGLSLIAPGRLTRMLLLLAFVPGMWIILGIDAFRAARAMAPRVRAWWQRPWGLIAIVLLFALVQPTLLETFLSRFVQPFSIPSPAMAPTMLDGDRIFASRRPPAVARGRIVIFDAGGDLRIYRVVGVPGDTLAMSEYRLTLNGVAQPEPYVLPDETGRGAWALDSVSSAAHTWGPLVVPLDSVFLLGDNRPAAADSRYRGFVAIDQIVGAPSWIYFSRDGETGEVRWERLGKRIE